MRKRRIWSMLFLTVAIQWQGLVIQRLIIVSVQKAGPRGIYHSALTDSLNIQQGRSHLCTPLWLLKDGFSFCFHCFLVGQLHLDPFRKECSGKCSPCSQLRSRDCWEGVSDSALTIGHPTGMLLIFIRGTFFPWNLASSKSDFFF